MIRGKPGWRYQKIASTKELTASEKDELNSQVDYDKFYMVEEHQPDEIWLHEGFA